MLPLFSIIIPTYNRSELLRDAVKSVIAQTYSDWELIIVDDGSTDNTCHLLSTIEDDRIKYNYINKAERSSARNYGIKKSSGKYICFLDDDDYILPDYLEGFYHYYEKNNFPELILRTGFYKLIAGKIVKSTNFNIKKHKNPVSYAAFNMCGIWSLAIPSKFLVANNFHISFPHWQDTHLILRLFAKHSFIQLNTYEYVYRIHDKMGSRLASTSDGVFFNLKLKQNIEPIEHFFTHYGDLVNQYLPPGTKNYLIAKKYYEFALYNLMYGDGKQFVVLSKKGIKTCMSFRFFKVYAVMIRELLKKVI